MGTCNYLLPLSIEIDPNLVITQDELRRWLSRAAHAAYDAEPETEMGHALNAAIIAAWRAGETELGCLLALLGPLEAKGRIPLAFRAAVQIAMDAEIQEIGAAMAAVK